jgi:hypothetical protein
MDKLATIVRWMARVWSVPSVVVLLVPYVMEGLYWLQAASIQEAIGHICFAAILAGLILAWWRERLGGALTVAGLAGFYITWWLHGESPRGPALILIAAPGFLFLLAWLLARYGPEASGAENLS